MTDWLGKWVLSLVAVEMALSASAASAEPKPKAGREKVLFFVAHPDDEIACAGTMLLMKDQFELHIGVLTHGERGLGLAGFRDGSTRAKRTLEEEASAAMVGAKVHWLEEFDGDCYANREVCAKLAALLKELRPRAVIGMWPLDTHLDHATSAMCLQKAVGIAGMRDKIEFYFMEESFNSRTFVPAHYVDISAVVEQKQEFIRKHVCANPGDHMCATEMHDGAARARRCATAALHVERFGVFDGKPQGSRCIFNEMPPPKGWDASWDAAKPSAYTPEGGMK